jgi:hypothetical protein
MATTGDMYEDRPSRAGGSMPGRRARGWWAVPTGRDYSSETRPFFVTSEFLVFVLYLMGLGIAASTSPDIDARMFWILATAASIGYMLSRGIAKSGSRSRAHDPREDLDLGRKE